MLVIERSIEHEAFPTGVGAVNSWRFLAVSLMPVSEGGEGGSDTPPPSQEVPPAATQPAAEAAAEALLLAASQAQGWCDNTSVLVLWIGW